MTSSYLFPQGRPFLCDPALFAAIVFPVSQIICWKIDRLKSDGLPVLLFADEPALCLEAPAGNTAVSEEKRLNALEDARMRGAYTGLHCCAARPFERMRRANPDILSLDANEGLDLFFADSHALNFVHEGGTVAYGLVPTRSGLNAGDAASIFIRRLEAASVAGDPQKFVQNAIITATCGLGLLDASSVAESFSVAHSIGKLIRTLEPVIHFGAGSDGRVFFRVREARREQYRAYWSDERQSNRENPPRPSVAAKTGPYFVVSLGLGIAKAFGLRLIWPDFRTQRCRFKVNNRL